MTFIKTDVSGAIATHAAIKQNVHGVGANDIADVADINTHAAVTTNIHGTGAGNVIVGNDEITGFGVSNSGNYAGNDSVNRAIPHGLGVTPKIILFSRGSIARMQKILTSGVLEYVTATAEVYYTVTAHDSTNFYVGNATNYDRSANANGQTYTWVAIG